MSINKVDIGYFEFLKESFNADLIVTGITVSIEQKIYFKDTKNELYVINSRHSKNIESGDKSSLENNKNINIENHKIRDNDFLDISIIKK